MVAAALFSMEIPPTYLGLSEEIKTPPFFRTVEENCSVVLKTTDSNTYKALRRDPTTSYEKKVTDKTWKRRKQWAILFITWRKHGCTDRHPNSHKEGAPLRPIIGSTKPLQNNFFLATLVGNTPHGLRNSTDFINKVQYLKYYQLKPLCH